MKAEPRAWQGAEPPWEPGAPRVLLALCIFITATRSHGYCLPPLTCSARHCSVAKTCHLFHRENHEGRGLTAGGHSAGGQAEPGKAQVYCCRGLRASQAHVGATSTDGAFPGGSRQGEAQQPVVHGGQAAQWLPFSDYSAARHAVQGPRGLPSLSAPSSQSPQSHAYYLLPLTCSLGQGLRRGLSPHLPVKKLTPGSTESPFRKGLLRASGGQLATRQRQVGAVPGQPRKVADPSLGSCC